MSFASTHRLPLRARLTVIIPTYGRSVMLERAIDSVLEQDRTPCILVVDDGSQPPARLHRIDARLSLVRIAKNAGGANARNFGVEHTSTPWITFLDDDDEWLPGTGALYEGLLPDEPEPDVCYVSGIEVVGPDGKKLEQRRAHSREKGQAWFLEPTPAGTSHLTKQTFIMPRSLYRQIGGFDPNLKSRIHSELSLRLNRAAEIRAIDRPTYRLHKHDLTQVSKNSVRRHRSFLYIWHKHQAAMMTHPVESARWAEDHARRLCEEGSVLPATHALWLAFRQSPKSAKSSSRIIASALRSRMFAAFSRSADS